MNHSRDLRTFPRHLCLALLCVLALGACASPGKPWQSPPPAGDTRSYGDWLAQARLHQSRGEIEQAERAAGHAISLSPGQAAPLVLIGDLKATVGLDDEAERAWRAALKLDGEFRPAAQALAWLLLAQGRIADAAALVSTARRVEELHLRGAVLVAQGELKSGEATLREAKNLAERLGGSSTRDVIQDIDCRLAGIRNPAAECPRGPVQPQPAP